MTGLYSISSPLARPELIPQPAKPSSWSKHPDPIEYWRDLDAKFAKIGDRLNDLNAAIATTGWQWQELLRDALRQREPDEARIVEDALWRVRNYPEALQIVATLATLRLMRYRDEMRQATWFEVRWCSAFGEGYTYRNSIDAILMVQAKFPAQLMQDAVAHLGHTLQSAPAESREGYTCRVAAGGLRFLARSNRPLWGPHTVTRGESTQRIRGRAIYEPPPDLVQYVEDALRPDFALPWEWARRGPSPGRFKAKAGAKLHAGDFLSLDHAGRVIPADPSSTIGVALEPARSGESVMVCIGNPPEITVGYFPETFIGDVQWRSGQDRPKSDSEKLEEVKLGGGALRPGELADACRWLDGEARRQPDNPLARPN